MPYNMSDKKIKSVSFILINSLLLFISSLLPTTSKAQSTFINDSIPFSTIKTIFQTLQTYEKMVITTNLDSLMENKRSDRQQEAMISLSAKDKGDLVLPIQIQKRGKSRRMMCDLPPLKLNFSKRTLDSLGLFPDYDKIKLVTHCSSKLDSEQLLLKEFWTYCLYKELTENSFGVHLYEITYIHSLDAQRTINSYVFVIENNAEMAHRIGGKLVDFSGMSHNQLTPTSYHHALLFNYMIGNTDWQVDVQQNLKLVQHPTDTLLTLVPYDFDYAKIVDAPYMKPYTKVKKIDPDNRYAMGKFANQQSLDATIQQFMTLRKTGFKCYKKCTFLKGKEKGRMSYYMQTFFQTLKNDKQMAKTFLVE